MTISSLQATNIALRSEQMVLEARLAELSKSFVPKATVEKLQQEREDLRKQLALAQKSSGVSSGGMSADELERQLKSRARAWKHSKRKRSRTRLKSRHCSSNRIRRSKWLRSSPPKNRPSFHRGRDRWSSMLNGRWMPDDLTRRKRNIKRCCGRTKRIPTRWCGLPRFRLNRTTWRMRRKTSTKL